MCKNRINKAMAGMLGVVSLAAACIPAGAASLSVTADMALWLDASDIDGNGLPDEIADGSVVDTWVDRSGNGLNATMTSGDPGYSAVSSTVSGRPVVTFDGNDQLGTPDLQTTLDDPDGSYTIFSVARYITPGGRVITSDHNWLFGFQATQVTRWYANGWVSLDADGGLSNSAWQQHTGLMDGLPTDPEGDFYLNGNLLAENSTGSSNVFANYAPRALLLGGWQNGLEYSDSEIAEIIVYDGLLTESERLEVEGYLNAKYFTDVPEPTSATLALFGLGALFTRRRRG